LSRRGSLALVVEGPDDGARRSVSRGKARGPRVGAPGRRGVKGFTEGRRACLADQRRSATPAMGEFWFAG